MPTKQENNEKEEMKKISMHEWRFSALSINKLLKSGGLNSLIAKFRDDVIALKWLKCHLKAYIT
jgi:hypothetical protein